MKELERRLRSWLWSEDAARSRTATLGVTGARLAAGLLRDLMAGELSLRAMSLVYSTVLAIVPLLAFSFSVLKGLGVHRGLEPLLMNFFEPFGERAAELTDSLILFVDNISSSGLATVSLVILIFTSLSMAQKVETSFNFVWRVDRPRSFARRLSEYLSVLLVGPVLMTVTFGLIAAIASTRLMSRIRELEPIGGWIASLGSLTPYLLIIAAFSLLNLFVPNTRVRTRAALAGGAFAGLLWVGSGNLFTSLVVDASRYEAIYSGFAIVIMAMVWLYFSWLILLLGTQLAFYIQNPDYLRYGQRTAEMSNGLRERLAFGVMLLVGRDFDDPQHGWRVESLAARMRVPRHYLEPVVGALMRERLLTETTDERLMPAKDLHRMSLLEISTAVRGHGRDAVGYGRDTRAVRDLSERIDAALRGALHGETLADLIARDAETEETPRRRLTEP